MSNIKLISMDIDGTLLNDYEEIPEYTKQVIDHVLKKDVHIVLNTGRMLKNTYPIAEHLNLTSYIITVNGGEIWSMDKKLIDRQIFEADKFKKLWKIARKMKMNRMWMMSTEEECIDILPNKYLNYYWVKFGCHSVEEDKIKKFINKVSHDGLYELTNWHPLIVEANPKGVNKASALEKVCKRLGIKMDEVLSIGDSLNDIKMIQQSGVGVAMGNAPEEVKKIADYITDTNLNNGVAKALEKFVLS